LTADALRSVAGQLQQASGDDSPVAKALPKASAPIAAQAISLPSGAATVSGMGESFTAQLTTGIATFNVPFSFPKARGAAQPILALVYGSSSGFGDAGVGWSLSGGMSIARQTDRGTPGYDDRDDFHINQDRFIFGGQELVPICTVTAGACSGARVDELFPTWSEAHQYFRPRTEGSFMRFFWSSDHRTWRIQSKDGLHFELGVPLSDASDTSGLEANPTRPQEIYRWHLVRQYDSHGEPDAVPAPLPTNLVVYRYRDDASVRYLSDVYYTPPAASPLTSDLSLFAHHLHVEWAQRPDPISSYRAGFLQEQRLRLARIDITSKPFANSSSSNRELVRRYHLNYEPGLHTSVLARVHLEGRCDNPTTETASGLLAASSCPRLPPLSFGYQRVRGNLAPAVLDAAGLAFEPFNRELRDLGDASPPHSLDEQLVALLDVNSDSLPDLLATAPGLYQGNHGLFLNGRAGDVGFGVAQKMAVTGATGVDASVLSFGNPNVSPLDPDGDATINLLHMPATKRYAIFSPQKQGSLFSWVGREISTAQEQDPKIDFTRDAVRIARADVNSDGLVDLVFSSATELQTFFALGRLPGGDTQFGHGELTSATSANLSTEPVRSCLPWSAQPIRFDDPEVRMADMNGDGLPDIVRLRSGQLLYWPGRGNGYWGTGERDDCLAGTFGQDRHIAVANAPAFGTAINGGLELADINADGLADLVEVRANAVDIYLNEGGQRFADRTTLTNVPFKSATSRYVQITDIDGTGTPDLLWGHAYEYRYLDLTGGVRPYLLTRVENGLGRVTELEYESSSKLMLSARKSGKPWKHDMPMATPVVVRSIVRDQLDKVGRTPGTYVTEYSYRDPFYDGPQREFRGFESADSRTLGDQDNPSVTTHSTFLLGECQPTQSGVDVCTAAERWRDNWREPLKGLPVVVETFDDAGVYLNTSHNRYELRQLYAGRDGRRVSVAYSIGRESFAYDTSSFDAIAAPVLLDEVQTNVDGISQSEARSVSRRATTGTVRLRSSATFDDFGNPLTQVAEGCVDGCESNDEVITSHSEHEVVPGDGSRWIFRATIGFITGSIHTERRAEVRQEYDAAGDVTRSFATIGGSLPLARFHSGGGEIAPPPERASNGTEAPVEVQTIEYTRDAFGNVVAGRAQDRCRAVSMDATYADLPLSETVYGGALDATTGCGELGFTTSATYDRGLSILLASVDVTGQPAQFSYDGFGRLTAKYFANPESPGILAALPSTTYDYYPPVDAAITPYSVVVVHEHDAESTSEPGYHDTYSYVDGLNRPIVTLNEADPLGGDGGDFVVGGVRNYNKKGGISKSFEPFFWVGEPFDYPLSMVPARGFTSQQSDAFDRPIATYGLDAQQKTLKRYHALSQDTFDALDLAMGPHHGTYSSVFADGHGRTVKAVERVRVGTPPALEERLQLLEYLPTGEALRVTQRRAGSPDAVRWLRYDSQGRLVLNVEPNTSQGFTPDLSADPATIKAIRYAYNDLGELVGTSDARGCGVNYFYDTAGRILAEDYSPCEPTQAEYSSPNFAAHTGIETLYHYDTADNSVGAVVDTNGTELAANPALYYGRAVSISDRGSRGVVRYDGRGRVVGSALQVAKPGPASNALSTRYSPRWYISETRLDAQGRSLETSTGVTTPELLGTDGKSTITARYSQRGVAFEMGSSYGVLSRDASVDADGRILAVRLGDAANTQRAFSYDVQRRMKTIQTYRAGLDLWSTPAYPTTSEATQQLSLEDSEFTYDAVNNVTAITDYRIPEEWPESAKPVSRSFEYDNLYRLTRSTLTYPTASDTWTSPYDAENEGRSDGPKPSPHVSFDERIHEQRYTYDHLGNLTQTTDDSSGFFDRSLGSQQHGGAGTGPHQLVSASNRNLAPSSERKGDLETTFDDAGHITGLLVRRDGPCLPTGASCWQRFLYGWDELGRLDLAKRWDLQGSERDANVGAPPPTRAADVELRNVYDAGSSRVLKTAIDPGGHQSHTVYINSTYELRSAWVSDGDYALTPETVTVRVPGGRVIYSEEDLPSLSSGRQHLFLQLTDYLGNGTTTIDHQTGELVELTTFQPYGGIESDYRTARWGEFRESYKFSGKEDDLEVGLTYFGARFLVVGLNRWASPDPVTIHDLKGDANPYAYVGGRPMVAVDPDGRAFFAAIAIGFFVGALIAGGTSIAVQYANTGQVNMGWKNGGVLQAALVGGIGGAVGGGVGTLVSGALSGTIAGSLGEAATAFGTSLATGTATAAAGYGADVALSGAKFDSGDFFGSVWTGTLTGAAFGFLNAASIGASEWSNSAPKQSIEGRTAAAAVGESFAVAAGQGGLAFGFLKALGASNQMAAIGGIAGATNGAVTGAHGTYNWNHPTGYLAAGLDATVGLMGSTLSNIQGLTGIGTYVAEASYRQNRMVFAGGIGFQDYAFTAGSNTVTNWDSDAGLLNLHESVHTWQSRLFGPLFQAGTIAFFLGGTPVGAIGSGFAGENFGNSAMASGYASNPFERAAYGNQSYWPPEDRMPKGFLAW
jgi:RHS repeat-associated protein